MKRFDLVDSLKGYSIATIVIFHYTQVLQLGFPYNKLINFGGTGVHLFAVLSGFGLYLSHLNHPLGYTDFIRKRLIKIYLPYLSVILLSACIALFIPIYENSLYALGGHIFLYKMFDEQIVGSYGYPLWFISMIIQFYFVFHGMVWLKSRLNDKWFLLSGIVVSLFWSTLVSVIGKEPERVWSSFFLQYYWEFALGMIIAERVSRGEKVAVIGFSRWLLLSVAFISYPLSLFLEVKGGGVGKLFNDFFAFTGYTVLVLFLFKLRIQFINRLFLFIGTISLPVFLLHTVVQLTVTNSMGGSPILQIIVSLALLLPLSVLFQKGIDYFFKYIFFRKVASKDSQYVPDSQLQPVAEIMPEKLSEEPVFIASS